MNKQAHLKTISALGLAVIIVLLAIYFPLTAIVVLTITAFIVIYMAIYTLFED
jgi:hypothetical protein